MDCLILKAPLSLGWSVFEGVCFGYKKFSQQKPEEFFSS